MGNKIVFDIWDLAKWFADVNAYILLKIPLDTMHPR